MGNEVKVSVRHELSKIIETLDQVNDHAQLLKNQFKTMGDDVESGIERNTKATETYVTNVRGFARRMADQIKSDFRSLISLNALGDSLKISNQFRGAIKESFDLSDSIRKLGGIFGIAKGNFESFQTKITEGLGEIGLSSEAATNALQGLSQTQVRGEENLIGYAKTAGMLGSVTREKGREGDIASGIARVLTARGQNPNDQKAMSMVAEDLRKTFLATGKGPTETLKTMEDIFAKMPEDLRKSISTKGLAQLASTAQIAGPGGTDFITQMLGKNPIARQALNAQGFGNVFSDKGLDVDKFQKASQSVLGRVGGDPRLAAKTLGLSDEAAEGFVRLASSLDRVRAAQEAMAAQTGSLEQSYRDSMGFGEAFMANINRIKRMLAAPLSFISMKGSDLLSGASQTDLGAGAVVAGGGALAALLAGYGLKGIGKGMGMGGIGGSLAKGAAASAVTGKEVQPVYVVNAAEIAAGGGAADMLGKGMGGGALATVGKLGAMGLAAGAGVYAGNKLSEATKGTELDKQYLAPFFDTLITMMQDMGALKKQEIVGPGGSQQVTQKVLIELNERQLKQSKQPSRGASY